MATYEEMLSQINLKEIALSDSKAEAVITYLKDLGTGSALPDTVDTGICSNLDIYMQDIVDMYELVAYYASTWPKTTKVLYWPVPGSYPRLGRINHWDNSQEGNDRRELCLHIACELARVYNLEHLVQGVSYNPIDTEA